ncbi:MAG: 3-hydroxyacyl-CoA dehydrogenase family protein [Acidimicrobiales bacterium]
MDHVDRALEQAGFPVGPFRLVDEVGLHVAAQTAEVLERAFGARLSRPAALVALAGAGRAGRPGGRGGYRYEDGRRLGVNPAVYDALGVAAKPTRPAHDIAARCLAAFADEAARCLEEGVVASAVDADLAACLGLGFPAALGGPFHYVDRCGAAAVLARVADSAPLLRRRVEDGAWFFPNPALPVALEERG